MVALPPIVIGIMMTRNGTTHTENHLSLSNPGACQHRRCDPFSLRNHCSNFTASTGCAVDGHGFFNDRRCSARNATIIKADATEMALV